jgi:SAM-dependent methyltransferase
MRIVLTCPICERGDLSPYWMLKVPEKGGVHTSMYRCGTCGLLVSNPMAGQEDLDKFYNTYYSEFLPAYLERDASEQTANEPRYVLLAEAMKKQFPRGGKVLDIGCGPGIFLSKFHPHFECHGVEPSAEAVAVAGTKGLDVKQGTVDRLDLPAVTYDVVVLWHVIEHLVDFMDALRKIHATLKLGGLLILGTENYKTANNRRNRFLSFMRGRIPAMTTASEHTWLFDGGSMRAALAKQGFVTDRIEMYRKGRLTSEPKRGELMEVIARKDSGH